mmetsp:Transcript_19258/g.58802  ORF Transcript_19258/g.58802 Transcript_19258/m.58802 type:complete len:773 (-) Transcript_19258:5-2323(-)
MCFSYYGGAAADLWQGCPEAKEPSPTPAVATAAPVAAGRGSASSLRPASPRPRGATPAIEVGCSGGLPSSNGNAHLKSSGSSGPSTGPGQPSTRLGGHSSGLSFYAYGPPGTPHSDFVRIVSANLPYSARPQRPSRTIQDWLVGCESVGQVLSIVDAHGNEFDGINICTSMHRIARAYREAPDPRLFSDERWRAALRHVERNLPSCSTRHISGTLWSLATVSYRGEELHRLLAVSRERLESFTCVDLALTAWSIATMKLEPPGLYDEISRLSIPRIGEFQTQALANICWATATLRKENDALIRNAAVVAAKHMDAGVPFRPHEYSTIVWSMVLTQAREEFLFRRVSQCVVRRITEFGPQELSNTVWAFAALGVKTEGLFEVVGEECRVKLSRFNNQNLTNLAWSYTHLGLECPALMAEVARLANDRTAEMNVQDLAQLALALCFIRSRNDGCVFGTEELTRSLVKRVTVAMVEKLRYSTEAYPDDAWMVHDLVLLWYREDEAARAIGSTWAELDSRVASLFAQVSDFLRFTPLLRYAQPCGAVVQTVHVQEYERAFRALDLRSLGIKYTSRLLAELGIPEPDSHFVGAASAQLEEDRTEMLAVEPGAGGQNWCFFRYQVSTIVEGEATRSAEELNGIRVRSCGGDAVALELLDPPFEAHLTPVKLSNDRLNHRKRDAEFRALAHTAGVLRALFPDADTLMAQRIWWGKRVQGWLHIRVTEVPCLSCLGAMIQFSKRFPHIDLRVSYPGAEEAGSASLTGAKGRGSSGKLLQR